MKACLDTHAVLWCLAGDTQLGSNARNIISSANRTELVISDIVLLEVSYLSAKGRISDTDGLDVLLAQISDSFRVLPITAEIASLALALDFPHGDPFDRVITATAKAHKIPLLTRDRLIAQSKAVETIW
jgi:PIN domain nuclease of toxin-antitoxin system